jgi:hypothetical protein
MFIPQNGGYVESESIQRQILYDFMQANCRFAFHAITSILSAHTTESRIACLHHLVVERHCTNEELIQHIFTCWEEPFDHTSIAFLAYQVMLQRRQEPHPTP